MKTKTLIGVGLAVALSALAAAAMDGFTIKRTPKVGELLKYKLSVQMDIGGQSAEFSGISQEKVVKVEADGTYEAEHSQLETKVKMGEQEFDAPASGPTMIVTKPNGLVKEIRGENVSPENYRMTNLGLFVQPDKMVNIGDTWNQEITGDTKTGAVAAAATFKVLAEEKVGTHDTLKIQATIKEKSGDQPASSESTLWLDKTTWVAVKLTSKWTSVPVPGVPTPINADVTITLIE